MDFRTAVRIFSDGNRIEIYGGEHSEFEDRYLAIGLIDSKMIVATVIYTERGRSLRVISARKASNQERRMYDDR